MEARRRRWRFMRRALATAGARATTAGWLSRLAWFAADGATAVRAVDAPSTAGAAAPGRELAMAYSERRSCAMLPVDIGERDRVGGPCDRARRAARDRRDPGPRAEQRRRRRGARAAAGCSGEARPQSRARARVRVRGARRARLHKPRLRRCLGAQLHERRPQPHHRDRLLRRARSRSLADLHDRLDGSPAVRAGAVG